MKKNSFFRRMAVWIGAGALSLLSFNALTAANPFLPLWEHIPDGEPYVFEDPDHPGKYRVYVYGSHDSLRKDYCGREQVLWSAPVDDLNNWRYEGIIFESKTDANGQLLNPDGIGDVLFAPDIMEVTGKDGKKTYYLYPNNQSEGRKTMIAKADRPDGPFKACNWDADQPTKTVGVFGFDPAAFIDDDGRVYGYWGYQESWGAELDPQTMATVKPGTEAIKDLVPNMNQPGDSRFFEASSMRKIQDKYVFIYSRWTKDGEFGLPGTNYTLAYAYSDSPLGPFTYGGTIIDGRGRDTDPTGKTIWTANPSGNTHGSIVEINGQWYVFYHRQSGTNEFSRQAMVAPIEVKVTPGKGGKVEISEAEYTSEGFETDGLNPYKVYPAGITCYYTSPEPSRHGWPNYTFPGSYVQATYLDGRTYENPYDLSVNMNPVINNTDGSVVGYKYYNFDRLHPDKAVGLKLQLVPEGIDGTIEVMIDSPWEAKGGVKVGSLKLAADEPSAATDKVIPLSKIQGLQGKHALFLRFSSPTAGKSLCKLHQLSFVDLP
ncbi:family 43 glycosylhydrolase [uncultured Bacteroides sp.]|uniref:family 43 glycosylhydrolase n=1 Tax=uncultured Bacteroides sp. TaxID=162156 RepID=UPI002625A010|nr:family 43 glycosylhydrolase [uncultured Bacteroides sp.]